MSYFRRNRRKSLRAKKLPKDKITRKDIAFGILAIVVVLILALLLIFVIAYFSVQ